MSVTNKIVAISVVLLGGAIGFRFWSLGQINSSLDQMLAAVAVSAAAPIVPAHISQPVAAIVPVVLASSTAVSAFTSSTSVPVASISSSSSTTAPMPTMSFIFPSRGAQLFNGCAYSVTWQSSTTINVLGLTLVDAGNQKNMGPANSGLAATTTIGAHQKFLWKVNAPWPGGYYISVFGINGAVAQARSHAFDINPIPAGTSQSAKESLCENAGGSLI